MWCFFGQIHSSEGGMVQTLEGEVAVDLNAVAEATLNHEGQLILTGEDGHGQLSLWRFFSNVVID